MNIENIKIYGALDGLRMEIQERIERVKLISGANFGTQVNTPAFAKYLEEAATLLTEISQLRAAYIEAQPKAKS